METTIEILEKRVKTCREVAADENESANAYRAHAKKAQAEADKHLAEAAMHQRAIEVLKAVEGIQKTGGMTADAATVKDAESSKAPAGWNHWAGGDCPVGGYVEVDVLLRGDRGPCTRGVLAKDLKWGHKPGLGDIVAWRLHVSE